MTNDDLTAAQDELITTLADLRMARLAASRAAAKLAGARQARAHELVSQLADAVNFCQRLCTVVEADLRLELLTGDRP
jgi:hypothetical protein